MKRENCASNRLYRGEATDFRNAIELAKQACHDEQVQNPTCKEDRDLNQSLEEYLCALNTALEIYNRVDCPATFMIQHKDETVQMIGLCLLSEDFAPMAI